MAREQPLLDAPGGIERVVPNATGGILAARSWQRPIARSGGNQ
jgi:hypothetical protein